MMKLPRKGCMVRANGEIYWPFEHNDPHSEFDAMPPFMIDTDGNMRSLAQPTDMVLNLEEAGLETGDMALLVHDIHKARYRKHRDGKWKFTTAVDADGPEIEHPFEGRLKARKAAREKKAQREQ